MPFDRFMIAPMEGGLQSDLKPWLIPDDAFETMENVYIFRGRVRKRFGSRYMNSSSSAATAQLSSRLRIAIEGGSGVGITDGSGNATGTAPGSTFALGQMFSIGTQLFTVQATGTPVTMLNTGAGSGTYDTTTGAYVFTGVTANTQIYFYPAQPVMGFVRYQTLDSTSDPTYAFDTEFAYQFTAGAWARLGTGSSVGIWTGTDSDFFWGTTWIGQAPSDRILFVTNNVASDRIQYWDGSVWKKPGTGGTAEFAVTSSVNLETALMVVVYKNYLVALNTTESGVTYTNRARWASIKGPLIVNGWRDDIPGFGNAIDAGTLEDIVSCGFIKDQLIVYFERSTWALKYTNNEVQPFVWQKINTELGAESTFSAVPFDKILLGIGSTGIHACNGANVERIDQKIPDVVWDIHTGNTIVDRVAGIRDFYVEQVYWTFPDTDTNEFSSTYPNKVLVYNYKTQSWAFNDDSITAFGYYYAAAQSAITWSSQDILWTSDTVTWQSGTSQALNQDIIAGNQEGYTFIIDSNVTTNAGALQISDLKITNGAVTVTCVNHNLNVTQIYEGDFVYLTNLNGITGTLGGAYPINTIIDEDTFTIGATDIYNRLVAGDVYVGGGTIARISRISFQTKQFNFYIQDDRNSYVQKVDFLVDRTTNGAITVDYMTSTSTNSGLSDGFATDSIMGTSVLETTPYALYPFEQTQVRLWHPLYFQSDGTNTQLRFFLDFDQMGDVNIMRSNFQLHAMIFYVVASNSRLQ